MHQSLAKPSRSKNPQPTLPGIFLAFLISLTTLTCAQAAIASSPVPTLVNYSGTLTDINGKPMTGVHGVTFLLYKDSAGSSAPLWMEIQNVQADSHGRYTAVLGSTTSLGLPTDLFTSGEARWLAAQPEGQLVHKLVSQGTHAVPILFDLLER